MKLKNNTRFLIACILIVVVIVSSIIVSVTDRAPGSSRSGPAVLKDPVTVTVSVDVDTNGLTGMLGSLEDSLSAPMDLIDSIVDLANEMSFSAVFDGSDMQLDVLLKDQQLIRAAVRNTGSEITVVSDMLPDNSVLVLTAEDIIPGAGGKQIDMRITTEDIRTLQSAVKSRLIRMADEVKSRADGSEEKGSWTYEDTEFTSRRKISLTAREAALIVLQTAQDLVNDPNVSPLLTRLGVDPESLNLDSEIKNIQDRPDDSFPALSAYQYSAGRNVCTEMVFAGSGVNATLRYGSVGDNTCVRLSWPQVATVDLVADSLGYGYQFSASVTAGQQNRTGYSSASPLLSQLTVSAEGITAQTGKRSGTISFGMAGMQFLTLEYASAKGGKVTSSFDRTGKQVLTSQDLSGQEFSRQMQTQSMILLNRISAIMPEAASGLMKSFFGMMSY